MRTKIAIVLSMMENRRDETHLRPGNQNSTLCLTLSHVAEIVNQLGCAAVSFGLRQMISAGGQGVVHLADRMQANAE